MKPTRKTPINCFSIENIANRSMFEITQWPYSNILKHTKTIVVTMVTM